MALLPNPEASPYSSCDFGSAEMTHYSGSPQNGVLSNYINKSAVHQSWEVEAVCLIKEDLMSEYACCRRTFCSNQSIEAKLSSICENVRTRKDHGRMSDGIGIALSSEDDLPAFDGHRISSPKLSPKSFESLISSSVISSLPAAKGSTIAGSSQGISCTYPAGVEMVIGSLVFTTRRAMPLNCALARETVIVFIKRLVYGKTMHWSDEKSRRANKMPLSTPTKVTPVADATVAPLPGATDR